MQSHLKVRAVRALGGVVVALAVVPWLGVAAASASGGGDGNCATRPAGVSPDATCTLLLGPNGTTVFGETWASRTTTNHLVVQTFPNLPLSGPGSVVLCVQTSGPYPPKHQCGPTDPDNVFTGTATTIDVDLSAHEINVGAPLWYGLTVMQGSSAAVSNGGVPPAPTPSPSPTTTSTSSSPTPSHSHTPSHSPTVSPTQTATHTPSHSPSVGATKTDATPSTSVLGTKLAHTGPAGVGGALVISIVLLGAGGLLLTASQTIPAAARRRH